MNYQKLFEDLRSGEFDPSKVTLVMDNDDGYWSGKLGDDDENEKIEEQMTEKYGQPDGYRDIVEVLCAAGISSEWC